MNDKPGDIHGDDLSIGLWSGTSTSYDKDGNVISSRSLYAKEEPMTFTTVSGKELQIVANEAGWANDRRLVAICAEVRAGRELRRAVAHLMLLVETKTPPELCGDALGSIAFALAKYPSQEKE